MKTTILILACIVGSTCLAVAQGQPTKQIPPQVTLKLTGAQTMDLLNKIDTLMNLISNSDLPINYVLKFQGRVNKSVGVVVTQVNQQLIDIKPEATPITNDSKKPAEKDTKQKPKANEVTKPNPKPAN